MPLSLNVRAVGRVTVIRCNGRIVAGPEAESLRTRIAGTLPHERYFVVGLADVPFIDSSGLGTLVRVLTSARRAGGDVKLCQPTPEVAKLLAITNLNQLFASYTTEEAAIAAFYHGGAEPSSARTTGVRLLCVDHSADVLAYVRELLTHAGYDVISTTSVPDALVLLRASRPALLVLGPDLEAALGTQQAFEREAASLPLVQLGQEFATLNAGDAAVDLLREIELKVGENRGPL